MGASLSSTSNISWTQVLIFGLIPLGQLWSRIFLMNGSLDKWYMMFPLFLFPPLSFIPMLMMKFGFIKEGQGAKPLDAIMWLPILAKFIIPFILPFIIDEDSELLFGIVSFVLQLLMIIIANMTRRYMNCKSITINSFGKSTVDSIIAHGIGDIVPFVMGWLPIVGVIYTIVSMIPLIGEFVDSIFWSLGFVAAYCVINMFNQYDMASYCNSPFFGLTRDIIPIIVSIIAMISINIFNNFSPI
jgi:hypothetical protein